MRRVAKEEVLKKTKPTPGAGEGGIPIWFQFSSDFFIIIVS